MQNKYLSALKTKYASFGLSKEALDRVALQRVKTIANEDEIDSDIANTETLMLIMKEMQSSADTQRNRATQLQKDLDDLKKNQPNDQTQEQEQESELAKQLQTLTNLVTTMQNERAAEKKKAQTETILTQVREKMKANGCTDGLILKLTLKGIKVEDTDTVDSLFEKYKPIYDQTLKEERGNGYIPPRGNGGANAEADNDAETEILQRRGLLPKSEN